MKRLSTIFGVILALSFYWAISNWSSCNKSRDTKTEVRRDTVNRIITIHDTVRLTRIRVERVSAPVEGIARLDTVLCTPCDTISVVYDLMQSRFELAIDYAPRVRDTAIVERTITVDSTVTIYADSRTFWDKVEDGAVLLGGGILIGAAAVLLLR